jgi:D-xylose transport system substrate-binding protein
MKKYIKLAITVFLFIVLIILSYFTIKNYNLYTSIKKDDNNVSNIVDNKIKVGFSLGTLKEERWIKDKDILMAKLTELGGDVLIQNANNNDEDQLQQVKYLISEGIDVLIIVPNDLEKASKAVELAKKNGIKVISYDRLILNSNVDLYISFDNVKVGEFMATSLVNNAPKGNYLIINGAKSDNNTTLIKNGYDKVLKNNNDINIIGEKWAENWMTEYAFNVTDEFIQEKHKIDAIIAGDDSLAGGAIKALSEHRLAGQVKVVAQDADLAACQRIVEGTQLMTVYKPIEKLAFAAANMAMAMAKGEEMNIKDTIYDGRYNVPYYVIQPIPVDINNIDETIIKDGFHMKNEVYRNK